MLDGELVCLAAGASGPVADFAALGAAMHSRDPAGVRVLYVAFDLLELGDEDLRRRPWRERDARLRELVADAGPTITAIDPLPVSREVHERLVELGFEGSVLKRADAHYRAGRSRAWLKHKTRHLTTGRVRAITVNEDRGRLALCELAGAERCDRTPFRARRCRHQRLLPPGRLR